MTSVSILSYLVTTEVGGTGSSLDGGNHIKCFFTQGVVTIEIDFGRNRIW